MTKITYSGGTMTTTTTHPSTIGDMLLRHFDQPDDFLLVRPDRNLGIVGTFTLNGMHWEVWNGTRLGRLRELSRHVRNGGEVTEREAHAPSARVPSIALDFDGRCDRFYVYRRP